MKKKGKIPGRYHKTLKEQVRENPRLAAVYVILRVLVVLALVAQVFNLSLIHILYSTSASLRAVTQWGHQLMMRLPL